jgi:hypothetical protein
MEQSGELWCGRGRQSVLVRVYEGPIMRLLVWGLLYCL